MGRLLCVFCGVWGCVVVMMMLKSWGWIFSVVWGVVCRIVLF